MKKHIRIISILLSLAILGAFPMATYGTTMGTYLVVSNEAVNGSGSTGTFDVETTDKKNTLEQSASQSMNSSDEGKYQQVDADIDVDWSEIIESRDKGAIKKSLNSLDSTLVLNTTKNFRIANFASNLMVYKTMRLAYVGDYSYVWTVANPGSDDAAYNVTDAEARTLGKEFDEKIHKSVTNNFSYEPDLDNNGKINIVCYNIIDGFNGVTQTSYTGGYFSGNDFGTGTNGNYGENIYIDTYPSMYISSGLNGSKNVEDCYSTIAHEFQHMVYAAENYLREGNKPTLDDTWITEGFAMAAEQIYGGQVLSSRVSYYNSDSTSAILNGQSLTIWNQNLSNYALSYLFFQYLKIQCGNDDTVFKEILNKGDNDYRDIEEVIHKYINPDMSFGQFMTNFRKALLANNATGLYGFKGISGFSFSPKTWTSSSSKNLTLNGGGATYKAINTIDMNIPTNKSSTISYSIMRDGKEVIKDVSNLTSKTYTGKPITQSVIVKNGSGLVLKAGVDYSVSYENNVEIGTAKAKIIGKGDYTNTVEKTFSIVEPANHVSSLDITLSESRYTYSGNENRPAVTVKDGNDTLNLNTDYDVDYINNVAAGTGIVNITGVGNYTGTTQVSFTIDKANPTYVVPVGIKIAYGRKLSDIELPEHFTWNNPELSVGEIGNKTFIATYTPPDTLNYNIIRDVYINVEVKAPESVEKIELDESSTIINNRASRYKIKATVLPANAENVSLSYRSENESVATVDSEGYIKAKANGNAVIIITSWDGKVTTTFNVLVEGLVEGISVDKTHIDIGTFGKSMQANASVLPGDSLNNRIIWTSNNSDLVSVSQTGLITSNSNGYTGTAIVTATTEDGNFSKNITVVVHGDCFYTFNCFDAYGNQIDCQLNYGENNWRSYSYGEKLLIKPRQLNGYICVGAYTDRNHLINVLNKEITFLDNINLEYVYQPIEPTKLTLSVDASGSFYGNISFYCVPNNLNAVDQWTLTSSDASVIGFHQGMGYSSSTTGLYNPSLISGAIRGTGKVTVTAKSMYGKATTTMTIVVNKNEEGRYIVERQVKPFLTVSVVATDKVKLAFPKYSNVKYYNIITKQPGGAVDVSSTKDYVSYANIGDLKYGATYTYYGRLAYSDGTYSMKSNIVSKKITVKPAINAVSGGYNTIKITTKPICTYKYQGVYYVYRSTNKKNWTLMWRKDAKFSFTDKKAKCGKTYYYKIIVRWGKHSLGSSIVSCKAIPSKPSQLYASAGKKYAKLTWSKVSGASGYYIYRATSKNGKYTKIKTITSGKTYTYINTKLKSKKYYYYKIKAYRIQSKRKVYGSYSSVKSVKIK